MSIDDRLGRWPCFPLPKDRRIKVCPHCFGRVMVMSDGTCPTCWEDTNASPKTDRRRFTISPGMSLPRVCVVCGEDTKRMTKIVDRLVTKSDADTSEPRLGGDTVARAAIGLFGGALGSMMGMLAAAGRQREAAINERNGDVEQSLIVEVPQCRRCRKADVRCVHADHENRVIVIVVHQRFIDHAN